MTKKDYELVAGVLAKAARTFGARGAVTSIAVDLADEFSAARPEFNRDRFLAASGVTS